MPSVPVEEIRLLVHLGLMLLFGLLAGDIVARARIPRVTGYILAGLIIGPSVAGLIDYEETRNFDLIAQLALGLIMFNIGGRFEAQHARLFTHKHLMVTAFEMGLTWILVGTAVWLVSRNAVVAVLAGFIAMESAPATTLVVVKEYDSEGPLTSNLLTLIGMNNFFCLALFPVLLMIVAGSSAGNGFPLFEVGKSLLLGVGLGLILSFLAERANTPAQQMVLGLCAIMLVVGLAYAWGGSGPLAALVMGAVKVNSSTRGMTLFERLDAGAYPLYVLFFVIAGANLHLKTLAGIGLLGFAYIGARAVGKILGAGLGARKAGMSKDLSRYLGPAMISHAGVAIGLAMAAGAIDSPSGKIVQTLVLASVVAYEMVGPIVVRFSLVRCGEVKMVTLLPHAPGHSSIDMLEKVFGQIRQSLGLPVRRLRPSDGPLTAKHVMRSHVETVPDTTRFDELLKIISHSRYDLLVVVDKDGGYLGNISLSGIRDVIFDQAVADLVIARDMIDYQPAYATPEQSLGEVLQTFQQIGDKTGHLPVVAEGEYPRVVGMVRQRDVVDLFRRMRSESKQPGRSQ